MVTDETLAACCAEQYKSQAVGDGRDATRRVALNSTRVRPLVTDETLRDVFGRHAQDGHRHAAKAAKTGPGLSKPRRFDGAPEQGPGDGDGALQRPRITVACHARA